jgi:hypothetical protein
MFLPLSSTGYFHSLEAIKQMRQQVKQVDQEAY